MNVLIPTDHMPFVVTQIVGAMLPTTHKRSRKTIAKRIITVCKKLDMFPKDFAPTYVGVVIDTNGANSLLFSDGA